MLKRRRLVPLGIALLAFTGVAGEAPAQQPAMSLVDLLEVPQLDDPQLSPDGSQILYVLSRADWESNGLSGDIWRVNADGSGSRQVSAGGRSPRWSPDGGTIAFLDGRGEMEPTLPGVRVALDRPGLADATQIFLLPNDGGEARPLTSHPTAVSDISWAPDGRSIYFLAFDPHTDEEIALHEARDDVFGFDEAYKQRHLWRVRVPDGAAERITSGDYSVLNYEVSRDGRQIVFHRAPDPNILQYVWDERPEVWIMDAQGAGALQLTNNRIPEQAASISPDGSQVLFLGMANDQFEYYYNRNIFVAPAGGGPARLLTGAFPYEIQAAAWSKDGRSILFTANMGVHGELFELDLAGGQPRQLTDGEHSIGSWSYQPTSDLQILTLSQPTNPGDIWVVPARSGELRRVTRVFDYLARDFRLPRQEKVEWKGADGVSVEGLLLYPLDYREGERYPLVVKTHGGPQTSDRFGFRAQAFTANGYAVLEPNYRGSTGYGDAFLRDMVGGYFTNSHLDVMAGVDHLIAIGIADPSQLAKMGWSGGGHMTNKIITFTDRFKAAASGAGASNWISMYAQSDMRVQRTPWFGGTPWQENAPIEAYWEHSPLRYAANVTTPTLFLVGENDVRVPPSQSIEMYRALKSNGVPTHLYIAPREGHGWQELRHQLFRMNVELDWFEEHVRGNSYVWEKAPGDTDAARRGTSSR